MRKMNNYGFTLIEVLAVIALIALLGGIAVPNVITAINKSNEKNEEFLIKNIKTASIELFEELDNNGGNIYDYNGDNEQVKLIVIDDRKSISFHLQTLVANGFLKGISDQNGIKKIVNPVTKKEIGNCEIEILKSVNNYKVDYIITSKSEDDNCPTY